MEGQCWRRFAALGLFWFAYHGLTPVAMCCRSFAANADANGSPLLLLNPPVRFPLPELVVPFAGSCIGRG